MLVIVNNTEAEVGTNERETHPSPVSGSVRSTFRYGYNVRFEKLFKRAYIAPKYECKANWIK